MNTETDKTAFRAGGHPDENQLLLALERELSRRDSRSRTTSRKLLELSRDPARCRVESGVRRV